MRGFALYLSRKENDPRREPLLAYWAAKPSDYLAALGRYLLDVGDRDAALSKVRDAENLAGAGWTIGLKAAREERYDEASDWFQVALEVGHERMAPAAWAWSFLTNWRRKDLFLSTVAAKKMTLPFHLGYDETALP